MTWPINREDVLDEIVSLYPLDQFESNHARAGLVYQDAVFAWLVVLLDGEEHE